MNSNQGVLSWELLNYTYKNMYIYAKGGPKLIKKREDKIRKIEIERYRKDRYTESDIYIHIKIHTFMYIFI